MPCDVHMKVGCKITYKWGVRLLNSKIGGVDVRYINYKTWALQFYPMRGNFMQ